jgi:hypothetical protein
MLRRCRFRTDHPTPAASTTGTPRQDRERNACAARLRTPNGFRHCENGRNAQLSPIIIHPEYP